MSMGGSEHTVDGNFYFGELHIVHANTKYPSLEEVLAAPDGLAVLGFFVDVSITIPLYIESIFFRSCSSLETLNKVLSSS